MAILLPLLVTARGRVAATWPRITAAALDWLPLAFVVAYCGAVWAFVVHMTGDTPAALLFSGDTPAALFRFAAWADATIVRFWPVQVAYVAAVAAVRVCVRAYVDVCVP